ncbi:hypothetical protein HCT53_05645 [Spirochaetales bacterium BR151]|nr:hypothetical protein [Entomospira culicis]NIZ19476.1 hypothetical protein [Entomospira culicis]WDI36730.1 hypothetical protein PVA46_05235 [Entomospira culicis]
MALFKRKDERWISEQMRIIYQEYEELKAMLPNAQELSDGFHDRYKLAERKGLDIQVFLTNELAHVQDLHKHYQKQQEEAREALVRKERAHATLNQEIARMALAYQHYPKCSFVPYQEFPELSHLYGAIQQFEAQHWHSLCMQLRKDHALTGNSGLTPLEQEMRMLVSQRDQSEPHALLAFTQSYRHQLSDIERAVLEATKEVGFFLNGLKSLLDALHYDKELPAYQAIDTMIRDFRLSSIKRQVI